MTGSNGGVDVVPAHLSYLALYSPSLSHSDETIEDQILYYYSSENGKRHTSDNTENVQTVAKHERLRQIGLAQGMVEFTKGFSDGKTIDAVDTHRTRVILHEVEPQWWILASINLTRITRTSASKKSEPPESTVEYSAREVSSSNLLLQQLLRAHRVFLLHHAPCLIDIYRKVGRPKLCNLLHRYWDTFLARWDVLLHGNPAAEVFNALRLASGGELGIGVGEEEWGSGEREVLEDFIMRTPGLFDLIVSRFGNDSQPESPSGVERHGNQSPELSNAPKHLEPSDGAIFSGVGAISRNSVHAISSWMEVLHTEGHEAYGIHQHPSSMRPRKRRKISSRLTRETSQTPVTIPPSLFSAHPKEQDKPVSNRQEDGDEEVNRSNNKTEAETESGFDTATMMKYLTLGAYGSKWSSPFLRKNSEQDASNAVRQYVDANKNEKTLEHRSIILRGSSKLPVAHYLVGLCGEVESEDEYDDTGTDGHDQSSIGPFERDEWIRHRRALVERCQPSPSSQESQEDESKYEWVSIVVYVQPPFMFTFLFDQNADSLRMPSFYKALHHQIGPLQRALLISTSPARVRERILESSPPKSTTSAANSLPVYSLIYDPATSTLQGTIPNIPDFQSAPQASHVWNRLEALAVHSQILNAYEATRMRTAELERTCKTSRGWWVVWMRLPHATGDHDRAREAFLVRRATDYAPPQQRKARGPFGSGGGDEGPWGYAKLQEGMGIGIDARQYIDGLLSLTR